MTELPFERAAMHNEPLPDGLNLSERKLYIALRSLYQQYKAGYINRDHASADKRVLIKDYEYELEKEKQTLEIGKLWERIEPFANAYGRSRTLENADNFYAAVYGLPQNWRCEQK